MKSVHYIKFSICLLFAIFAFAGCGDHSSLYKTPAHKVKILEIYNSKLAKWPVPFDTLYIKTKLGRTHIVVSGSKENPPLILLHAMGVTSMMWLDNVEALSSLYRVYAVDELGDIGKSELYDTGNYLDSPQKYKCWLNEILDSLHIRKASFIGASFGGWITMHYAISSPRRVDRVILLGPMGISSVTLKVLWRLMSLVINPTDEKKQDMIDWAIGENKATRDKFYEHMWTAMDCQGFMAPPWELTKQELRKIKAPVLLLLGEKDGPVGEPSEPKARAEKYIPNVQVKIIQSSGHLISSDCPETVNKMILDFLTNPLTHKDKNNE